MIRVSIPADLACFDVRQATLSEVAQRGTCDVHRDHGSERLESGRVVHAYSALPSAGGVRVEESAGAPGGETAPLTPPQLERVRRGRTRSLRGKRETDAARLHAHFATRGATRARDGRAEKIISRSVPSAR